MERVSRRQVVDLAPDGALFVAGSLLQFGVVYGGVPTLTAAGMERMVAWMVLSVPCIFAPLSL